MNKHQKIFKRKLLFTFLACCILLVSVSAMKRASSQAARTAVSPQPDAPLRLQILHPESTADDQYAPKEDVVVANASGRDVSAYAIKYDIVIGGELRPGGVELNQSTTANSLFRPGDTRTVTVGDAHYSRPVERVVVSLDFVEFTDASTWGADTYSSKEVLAGLRAGARTMAKHLLGVLAEKGMNALSAELDQTGDDIGARDGSAKWQEGFQRGASFIKARAKHEIKTFSNAEVERVLALPIDALDEIKKR
ncbi:MAG TPA: hypothetical protein VN937_15740 [Blastocatellia bacterium]|nr:hypothetical protein [Blastocatellia bacterium]